MITDDSTRNVLDYYFAPGTINHGTPLGDGLTAYDMNGRRLIVIPKFHFFQCDFRQIWPLIDRHLDADSRERVWLTYCWYHIPQMKLGSLAGHWPPGKVLQRKSLNGNEILQIAFRNPESGGLADRGENRAVGGR